MHDGIGGGARSRTEGRESHLPVLELMFDTAGMPAAARSETVAALQARIASMQARTLGARTMPTNEAVAPLLPGGALRSGVAYAAPGSLALAMLLLAGPSAAGAWCGVVGIPEFGAEAAAELGIALDRLVLVPAPAEHWLSVTAQLAEVLPVVLVRPPAAGASPGEVSRLASRLRQRDATLLVAGRWSGAEATLEVTGGSWSGIGAGWGYLSARELDVVVTAREVRSRHRLRIETGFRLGAPLPAAAPQPAPRLVAV
ncbi:hypothetical protein GCM10025783_12730 [Amnibacterium soli]|uniref:Protein ImuA n=2 Tax=Amnibacterium soli TaxID=1282736 RepID=A0ABP8YZP4_9MICO